jgi:hypothetical protein
MHDAMAVNVIEHIADLLRNANSALSEKLRLITQQFA